jgi:hypothetical protein
VTALSSAHTDGSSFHINAATTKGFKEQLAGPLARREKKTFPHKIQLCPAAVDCEGEALCRMHSELATESGRECQHSTWQIER